MQTIDRNPFLTKPLRAKVYTTANNEAPVTPDFGVDDSDREAWDAIEGKLIDWGRHPEQFDEEEIAPPSTETIRLAIQVANILARQRYPIPTRVVPGSGGEVVFERQEKNWFASIHVCSEEGIEFRLFKNHCLVTRDIIAPMAVDAE